uniref:Phosphoglycerate kinase n=1 Tax=Oryza punctata TaxID=4537 RepID=A0A0E0M832_ORYPU
MSHHIIRPDPKSATPYPRWLPLRNGTEADNSSPRRASRSRTPPPRREASGSASSSSSTGRDGGGWPRGSVRANGSGAAAGKFSGASASVRGTRKDGLMQKACSVQLLRPSRSLRRESWPQSGGSVVTGRPCYLRGSRRLSRLNGMVLCFQPPQSASVVHLEEEDKYSCIDRSTSYLYVQSVRDFPIEKLNGEVVLVRLDSQLLCNPLGPCSLSLERTVSTIKYLYKAGAKVFLVTSWTPVLRSVNPVLKSTETFADYMSSLLQVKVVPVNGVPGLTSFKPEEWMRNDIILFENLLNFKGETANCNDFSQKLASEKNATKEVLQLIETAHNRNIPIYYPTDTWCLNNKNNNHEKLEILNSAELLPGWTPADIGPSTLEKISSLIPLYKKVLWIGPTGFDLTEEFSGGATQLGRLLDKASHNSCDIILVGSAACKAVKGISGSSSKYTTFKNASVVLEFLKGKILPGVAALDKSYPYQIPWNAIFSDSSQPLVVDIGSGNGLFLFQMAKNWEGSNFLGLEMNKKLVVRCLRDVASVDKRNLYFVSTNATSTFRSILSSYPGHLALVTIQCPNPDFNKEQNRWRMVRRMLVEAIADLLQPNGKSDVESVLFGMKEQFMTYGKGRLVVDGDGGGGHQMDNPFGAASDWERHVLARGAPMYRTMLSKSPMSETVATLIADDRRTDHAPKTFWCVSMAASMLNVTYVGGSSGSGALPSRYCITCRMLGLAAGDGCRHSTSTKRSSSSAPATASSSSSSSIGLLPQVTSRRNAPKANTSERVVALPERTISGAKYPMVPTTCVVCGSSPPGVTVAMPSSASAAPPNPSYTNPTPPPPPPSPPAASTPTAAARRSTTSHGKDTMAKNARSLSPRHLSRRRSHVMFREKFYNQVIA